MAMGADVNAKNVSGRGREPWRRMGGRAAGQNHVRELAARGWAAEPSRLRQEDRRKWGGRAGVVCAQVRFYFKRGAGGRGRWARGRVFIDVSREAYSASVESTEN